MKIAITSQNRKTVTGHAGKCRRFWIYEVEAGRVTGRELLELGLQESFHESRGQGPHPLDGVRALISGGMGEGLRLRLGQKGIDARTTSETDPDRAVAAYLAGNLPAGNPEHGHDHGHAGQPARWTSSVAIPVLARPVKAGAKTDSQS